MEVHERTSKRVEGLEFRVGMSTWNETLNREPTKRTLKGFRVEGLLQMKTNQSRSKLKVDIKNMKKGLWSRV
jgi:hypothetical protein